MVTLPVHAVTEAVGLPVTTVEVRVGTAVVGTTVPVGMVVDVTCGVRVGQPPAGVQVAVAMVVGVVVTAGVPVGQPPPGRPVMVRVYAEQPAFSFTSCTFNTKVVLAGTLNENAPVGLGLAPRSATQFWHMFAGSKLVRYAPT